MLSDETFRFLIEYGAYLAGVPRNPFRCPCLEAPDFSACLRNRRLELTHSGQRRRPRAARSRRRRSRTTHGRSDEPAGDSSDGPGSHKPIHHRPCNTPACSVNASARLRKRGKSQ